jgi:hypothetical protein
MMAWRSAVVGVSPYPLTWLWTAAERYAPAESPRLLGIEDSAGALF